MITCILSVSLQVEMENPNQSIEEKIKSFALDLGFDLIGFSPATLPRSPQETFINWIESDQYGDMNYLSKRLIENRQNQSLFGNAKTVISLGMNYFQGEIRDSKPNPLEPNSVQADSKNGRVARYAITRDYHKIITAKLKKLSQYLENNFNCNTRFYVDTGPILERAYASQAKLGYLGNNSCLISEELGSWIFLAEVMIDLQLQFIQKEIKISCGSCRRCVDICPTKAINNDKTIDARKCISYLTIENKGPIPLELRKKIGNWLYGCDICQDVCPHNAKAKPTRVEDFQDIRIENRQLNLATVLQISTDAQFLELFAGSPIMRAKRRGLLRNACVVAGNSGNKDLIPILQNIVDSEDDEMLREHADWALQQIMASL